MEFHTNLRLVFDAIGNRQVEFNWLLTDIECNYYPVDELHQKVIWISGEKLTEIVARFNIQFIWGVFSAFGKDVVLDPQNLTVKPYADGNSNFWVEKPKIQHPLATAEIVRN